MVVANYYRHAYWSHVFAAVFIAALGPFQFIAKVRKYHGFIVHQWFGLLLLIHQSSATIMFLTAVLYSNAPFNAVLTSEAQTQKMIIFWHYACCFGFLLWNVHSWFAIILGWKAILHGAMMHRLGAMWFRNVVAVRILPLFTAALIPNMTLNLVVDIYFVFLVSTGLIEWYVWKAERFPAEPEVEGAQCPFLATQSENPPQVQLPRQTQ